MPCHCIHFICRYHGRMSLSERRESHTLFLRDDLEVMVRAMDPRGPVIQLNVRSHTICRVSLAESKVHLL